MDDREIDQHCAEWINWCRTRRYYVQPGAKNILARMQPSRSGEPPNARNDADMQFFNAAVQSLAEDDEDNRKTFICFKLFYLEPRKNIKKAISEYEVARSSYYRLAREFVRKAISLATAIKKAHSNSGNQIVEFAD